MNRRLKEMLKSTYGAEPERKISFIGQLRSNPVWRRLHPISSLIKIPPSYLIIPAAAAVAAAGTGIIAYNIINSGNYQPVPDQEAVMETELPSAPETDIVFTVTLPSETKVTEVRTTAKKNSRLSDRSSMPLSYTENKQPFETAADSGTYTTAPAADANAPAVSSSIYHTHLFDHVRNISDLRNHYEDIKNNQNMPGYPDYNYFEDMLRLIFEESGKDYDELTEEIGDYFSGDLSYEVLNGVFTLREPPVIEGETTGIEYTAYNGRPWTVCEITISKVYNCDAKHVFCAGDKVKIAMPGGYMSARRYVELNPGSKLFSGWTDAKINSTTIYEDGSNQNAPKIGDVFTYIISYEDNIPGFPVEGCLTRFSLNDMAQFTRNGEVFTSCNSNFSDMYFTLDQMNDNLFKFRNVFNDPDSGRSIGIKDNSFLLYGEFDCYSIGEDGTVTYLGSCSTDRGFYPFNEESDYSVTWTDDGVIIKYRFDYGSEIFNTIKFSLPK